MQFILTTLSPIHIGTGNVLEPFDYYIHNQKIYVMDHDACLKALYDDDPSNVEKFSLWVERTVERINKADREAKEARRKKNKQLSKDKNQILSDLRNEFNIVDFSKNILKKNELAKRFLKEPHFWKYSANVPNRPRRMVQLKEIIKTNNMPFIPGSSIKGALRTALAFKVISKLDQNSVHHLLQAQDTESEGLKELLQKIITAANEVRKALQSKNINWQKEVFYQWNKLRKRYEKKAGKQIEKYIFGCDDGKGKLGDPKYDLMRLIKISDTGKSDASMLVAEMKSFTKEGRTGKINAQPVNITEFIDFESKFQFSIEVDVPLIRALSKRNNVKEWRGFDEKMKRLFNLNADMVSKLSAKEIERKIVSSILEAVQSFGEAVKEKEKTWLEQFTPRERNELERFIKSLNTKRNVLKLGFASGWFSTTVGLALLRNPYLKNILPEIIFAFNLDLIMKDEKILRKPPLDNRTAARQQRLLQRMPDIKSFPKSRRLLADKYIPSEYIGWVEINEGELKILEKEKNTKAQNEKKYNDFSNMDEAIAALKEHFR